MEAPGLGFGKVLCEVGCGTWHPKAVCEVMRFLSIVKSEILGKSPLMADYNVYSRQDPLNTIGGPQKVKE